MDSQVAYSLIGKGSVNGKSADELTGQQWEIARLVARGLTNREVADKLFLSENTIKFHKKTSWINFL